MIPARFLRRRRAASCAMAALASLPSLAHAISTTWTFAGSGNWSVASNWNPGVPGAGSDVALTTNGTINRTVNYDYAGASIQFNSLSISNFGFGSGLMIFSQAANTFNCITENVGNPLPGTTGPG